MKKITLDLDNLVVESFETGRDAFPRGTVEGRDASNVRCNSDISCMVDTCNFRSCNPSDCDRCVGGSEFGSCDYCESNDPCAYTPDGAASCDAYNTCISTCEGLPECG